MTPEPQPGKTACYILVKQQWVHSENSEKTSPKLRRAMPDGSSTYGTHAEDRALQLARRIGGKIRRVLVLRWDKHGKLTMARPCGHCKARMAMAGIRDRRISWSNWRGEIVGGE